MIDLEQFRGVVVLERRWRTIGQRPRITRRTLHCAGGGALLALRVMRYWIIGKLQDTGT